MDLDKYSGHRGGHSCKTKHVREQYQRYNAVGHLVVQNSAGPVYDSRFYFETIFFSSKLVFDFHQIEYMYSE